MFDNDSKNERNFEKIEDEINETESILKKLSPLMRTIKQSLDKAAGTDFGQTLDSGELSSGEKFDLVNVFNQDSGEIEPTFIIDKGNGNLEVINQKDVNKKILNEAKQIIPNLTQEIEENQWWDIYDKFPNKVKYIDVYNATTDFNVKEELERLRKINPKRYSDTIIRVQPVIIDPE